MEIIEGLIVAVAIVSLIWFISIPFSYKKFQEEQDRDKK